MGHEKRRGIYVQEQRKHDSATRVKNVRERAKLRRSLGDLLRSSDVGVVHLITRVRIAKERRGWIRRKVTLVANRKEHNDSFM